MPLTYILLEDSIAVMLIFGLVKFLGLLFKLFGKFCMKKSLSFGVEIRLCICIFINYRNWHFIYIYFERTFFRNYQNHILAKDVFDPCIFVILISKGFRDPFLNRYLNIYVHSMVFSHEKDYSVQKY